MISGKFSLQMRRVTMEVPRVTPQKFGMQLVLQEGAY